MNKICWSESGAQKSWNEGTIEAGEKARFIAMGAHRATIPCQEYVFLSAQHWVMWQGRWRSFTAPDGVNNETVKIFSSAAAGQVAWNTACRCLTRHAQRKAISPF